MSFLRVYLWIGNFALFVMAVIGIGAFSSDLIKDGLPKKKMDWLFIFGFFICSVTFCFTWVYFHYTYLMYGWDELFT